MVLIVLGIVCALSYADITSKTYLAADALWAAANTSIKFSIVHFYITIFRSSTIFRKIANTVIILIIALGVAILISDVLTCRPLSKYWNPLERGVCQDPIKSFVALSSCNIAIDLIIILLPMPMIWGLQMATMRKIELTFIFAIGFVYVVQCMLP